MKFKQITPEICRVGVTDLYLRRVSEAHWECWEREGDTLYRLKTAWNQRKYAAEVYFGSVKRKEAPDLSRTGETMPVPTQSIKREQPPQLMNFFSELKKL